MFDFIDFGTRDHLRPVNWDGKMPIEIAAPATAGAAPAAAPAGEKKIGRSLKAIFEFPALPEAE